jgi:hypothetical protein
MAEGDGEVYGVFKERVMEGLYNLASGGDSIKVALWSTYTPDYDADNVYADVTGTECSGTGYTAGGKAITGQDVTETGTGTLVRGKFDATDLTWTAISAGTPAYGVMYDDTVTTPVIDPLIAVWEVTTATNGGDYTLQWNANGIIRIS